MSPGLWTVAILLAFALDLVYFGGGAPRRKS